MGNVKRGKSKGRRCPRCKGSGKRPPKISFRGSGFGLPIMEDSGGRCDYCGGSGRIER